MENPRKAMLPERIKAGIDKLRAELFKPQIGLIYCKGKNLDLIASGMFFGSGYMYEIHMHVLDEFLTKNQQYGLIHGHTSRKNDISNDDLPIIGKSLKRNHSDNKYFISAPENLYLFSLNNDILEKVKNGEKKIIVDRKNFMNPLEIALNNSDYKGIEEAIRKKLIPIFKMYATVPHYFE